MAHLSRDQILVQVLNTMHRHSFSTICAGGVLGCPAPSLLACGRPDATSLGENRPCIVAVVPHDELDRCQGRLMAFLAAARQQGGMLIVAVAREDKSAVADLLERVGANPANTVDAVIWPY